MLTHPPHPDLALMTNKSRMVAQICALNAIKILRPQKHNLCVNIEQHQRLAGALGYVTLQDRLSHLQVGFGHGATHEIGTLGGNFGITRVLGTTRVPLSLRVDSHDLIDRIQRLEEREHPTRGPMLGQGKPPPED